MKPEIQLALGWPTEPAIRAQIEAQAGKPLPIYEGMVGGFSCLMCSTPIELGPQLAAVVNAGDAAPICGPCAAIAKALGADLTVRDLGNTPINDPK